MGKLSSINIMPNNSNIFADGIEGFEWMSQVARNSHEYTELMSRKSHTAQLPIINANETKHEDCLKLMDTYENNPKIHDTL
jgi:hypothetical protein